MKSSGKKSNQATDKDIDAPRLTAQGRENPNASGQDSTNPMGEGAKKGQSSKAEG
ncbi:hypothetical protein MHY87_08920 [Microvirga sp. ACRRW]|uniref:hypothetical protein n=1 Tax=Microvirga sp. ACRRW TaxID=2918205 RepID=UPI001EF43927|nr:hypothetical protein [Microvirga sp. ACRRW]MCG7393024.1 hypothetical protein [Microvirga sp. ACRRW]